MAEPAIAPEERGGVGDLDTTAGVLDFVRHGVATQAGRVPSGQVQSLHRGADVTGDHQQ